MLVIALVVRQSTLFVKQILHLIQNSVLGGDRIAMAFVASGVRALRSCAFVYKRVSPICHRTSCSTYAFRSRTYMATAPPPEAFEPTIFDKIIAKEIKADVVYEDDQCLAFNDINPQAPVHVLLIPKRRISMLSMAEESDKDLLGTLLLKADQVAKTVGLDEGYRILSTFVKIMFTGD